MKNQSNLKQICHITRLIRSEVGFFNGWWVDEKVETKACEKAAKNILEYLKRKKKTVDLKKE